MGAARGIVRLSVADRGPGIPEEGIGRLYQTYDRVGRDDGKGLGIGLSVVRSIVEAHGGQVGFRNRRLGGSIFWLELALIEATPATISESALRRRWTDAEVVA